jgi:hypothetical protein
MQVAWNFCSQVRKTVISPCKNIYIFEFNDQCQFFYNVLPNRTVLNYFLDGSKSISPKGGSVYYH